MLKYAFFPGCSLKTTARNFESSAKAASEQLGFALMELPQWNCCGTVFNLTQDDLIHHLGPVRTLIQAEAYCKQIGCEKNYLLTLCAMCYNTLKRVNILTQQDPERIRTLLSFMDQEPNNYEGSIQVIHFLELFKDISDQVKTQVRNPLKNLKIAPYYGCLLLRPKEIAIDNPEHPSLLETMIKSMGATPVEYYGKTRCCGSYHTVDRKDLVLDLTRTILTDAQSAGADVLMTSCPLCAFNLDARQQDLVHQQKGFRTIPVLYFTQLLALAFGCYESVLGLEYNWVNPRIPLRTYLDSLPAPQQKGITTQLPRRLLR